MKIRIITLAGTSNPDCDALFDDFFSRLQHYCKTEKISLKATHADEEAKLILKHAGSFQLILLDEKGKELSSVALAHWLQQQMNMSSNLCFVIGSAYGFNAALKEKCGLMISLSKMTLPHQIAKVVFCEQLYRAFTILRHEKYHH